MIKATKTTNWEPSEEQKQRLLDLSRKAITAYIRYQEIPDYNTSDPDLLRPAAAFVTLTTNDFLRGCVGGIVPQNPLYLAVQHAAVSAAFGDPRFPPLQLEELDHLRIKIAILSLLVPIQPEEIIIGVHGLMIHHEGKRGLLLPEVASGRKWDVDTYLENLCSKANLPASAWKQIPTIFAFTTTIIQQA